MNNLEKFTTRSSKLKVPRENSLTISSFPVLSSCFFVLFCFVFLLFLIKYIDSDTHLTMRVSEISTRPIPGNRTTFFWPN